MGVPFGGGEVASGEAAGGGGEVFGVEVPDDDAVAAATEGDGQAVGAQGDAPPAAVNWRVIGSPRRVRLATS